MKRQQAALESAEQAVLDHLRAASLPLTAREVALLLGWPPQRAIWALARLAARGDVTVSEGERKDQCYRVRRFARYRPAMAPRALYPAWMMPRPVLIVKARLVRGKAFHDDEED
jgi:hypothetical protein